MLFDRDARVWRLIAVPGPRVIGLCLAEVRYGKAKAMPLFCRGSIRYILAKNILSMGTDISTVASEVTRCVKARGA